MLFLLLELLLQYFVVEFMLLDTSFVDLKLILNIGSDTIGLDSEYFDLLKDLFITIFTPLLQKTKDILQIKLSNELGLFSLILGLVNHLIDKSEESKSDDRIL